MENIDYKVNRDDIYVGEVILANNIYRYEGDTDFFRTKPGELMTGSYYPSRSILFVPNEEKLSNDLLCMSPSYPILNVTDDDICLGLSERSIVIKDAFNLAELLEYYRYRYLLTYEDIINIRKTFFTGRFGMDNCELFGWREVNPEDWTYLNKNGVEVTDPKELKRRIAEQRRFQKAGNRAFTGGKENILPRDLMDVLDDRGRSSQYYIFWKKDAFKPSKEEGKIISLTRKAS